MDGSPTVRYGKINIMCNSKGKYIAILTALCSVITIALFVCFHADIIRDHAIQWHEEYRQLQHVRRMDRLLRQSVENYEKAVIGVEKSDIQFSHYFGRGLERCAD